MNDQPVRHFGREYQRYPLQSRIYCVPYDEEEEERHDLFHEILRIVFEDRLFLADVETPRRVLDCGSGFGNWAEAVSEELDYADCEVYAIDIHHVHKTQLYYQRRWNLNEPFTVNGGWASRSYDLVNSCCVANGINGDRWASYVQDLSDRLKPGGWLQMIELDLLVQSNDGREPRYLREWWDGYSYDLVHRQNKDLRAMRELRRLMGDAGLTGIKSESRQLRLGEWHEGGPALGLSTADVILRSLRSFGLWSFCGNSGMDQAEFDMLIERCREEMQDPGARLYVDLHVFLGQRPKVASPPGLYTPRPRLPPLPAHSFD